MSLPSQVRFRIKERSYKEFSEGNENTWVGIDPEQLGQFKLVRDTVWILTVVDPRQVIPGADAHKFER